MLVAFPTRLSQLPLVEIELAMEAEGGVEAIFGHPA
jgi:hypothetical protein